MVSYYLKCQLKCGSYDLCDTTALSQTIIFSYLQMQGKIIQTRYKYKQNNANRGGSKSLEKV